MIFMRMQAKRTGGAGDRGETLDLLVSHARRRH